MEHKEFWGLQGEVDSRAIHGPLGKARLARAGTDLTLVTWSRMVHRRSPPPSGLARQGYRSR